MRIVLSLVFLLVCTFASAQFGISAKFNSNSFDKWNEHFSGTNQPTNGIHSTGYEFGANYWLRLKDKRIEFLPEISYSINNKFEANFVDPLFFPNTEFSMSSIHLNFPTHLYFLDINNDCNCPTFSKQSDFLSKGLYVFLSPGISYNTNKVTFSATENNDINESSISYRVGAGLGYDVGLSDLLTITPFFSYNYGFGYSSEHLVAFTQITCPECSVVPSAKSSLTQLQFGVRVSFRPDYQSNNF